MVTPARPGSPEGRMAAAVRSEVMAHLAETTDHPDSEEFLIGMFEALGYVPASTAARRYLQDQWTLQFALHLADALNLNLKVTRDGI